jgi:hypothetical protein
MNMVTVTIDELPRQDGFPIGRYRVRYSTVTVTMFDCALVDGVTPEPVTGRTLTRLHQTYGSDCTIEPWDSETAELVGRYLEESGKGHRASQVRGEVPVPRPHQEAIRPGLRRQEPPSSAPSPTVTAAAHRHAVRPVGAVEPVIDHDVDMISDLNVLRSIAASLGVEVDERWKQPRLRLEIHKARDAAR